MIPSSIRPQRGPFKPAPHAAALLPALARARYQHVRGTNTYPAALNTRYRRTHSANAHGTRAHGVNAHGTGIHDANAQTGLTRTQFSRARTLTHEPCLRTRGLHSPPEVIIQRLENVGYERLEDMNDCFFWTQILLSSPQVNGMTKTEDMNDSFISSASAREIVHNFWPFISSCRSYPPTVHILPIGQIRTHVVRAP